MYFFVFCFFFLDQNTKRQSGRKVQISNIEAAKVSFIKFQFPWK